MAVTDYLKRNREERDDSRPKVPELIDNRLNRGRDRMRKDSNKVRESFRFWRGDQYVYVNEKGYLQTQPTVTFVSGGGKPQHRVRIPNNLIQPIVRQEVSYATQRFPSYQVNPSTTDPRKVAAARLSERIAIYLHDKADIRASTVDAVTQAVVGDESFAWPYWDSTIGPFVLDDEGEMVGQGDVKVRIFGRNECYWEPGLRFEDSPWHAVELAMAESELKDQDGYIDGPLKPDASSSDSPSQEGKKAEGSNKLVLVTHYLEHPCPKYPEGKWLTFANKRQILEAKPYPVKEGLCLHKLTYIRDPDADRDQGLVKQLVPLQRVYNDCVNKMLEAKNLGLNAQLLAPRGSEIKPRLNDEPGAIFEYNPVFGQQPQWKPPPPSEIFAHLRNIAEQTQADMQKIAAQNDIPSQVSAGSAVQTLVERDQNARQEFVANLAQWYSRVMRHMLTLVQQHYTEPRLIRFRGPFGWESIDDFMGASLLNQIDIRVFPDSIEPKTRQYFEQKAQNMFQLGLISAEECRLIMEGGGEMIVDSFEQDVARANRIIQRIKGGPQDFMSMPERFDSKSGETVPGWMPRPFDNPKVQRQVIADYMKGQEFDESDPPTQEAFYLYYDGLEQLIQQKEMEAAMNQQNMAEGLGMQNAGKPQGAAPMPTQPGLDSAAKPNNEPPKPQ